VRRRSVNEVISSSQQLNTFHHEMYSPQLPECQLNSVSLFGWRV
jgi:hypothetical protein